MTSLDLLVESYNLLFEWRGRVGSVHMEDVYLESALVKKIAFMQTAEFSLPRQVSSDAANSHSTTAL